MQGRNRRAGAIAALALFAVAASAAPASAQTCGVTGLNVFGTAIGSIPNGACQDASTDVVDLGLLAAQIGGTTAVTPGSAARAESALGHVYVRLGGLNIYAGVLRSRASAQCDGAAVGAASESLVEVIAVNGRPLSRGNRPDAPYSLRLNPLLTLHANRQVRTATGVTQRALQLDLLGQTVLVAGEASAGCPRPTPVP